MTMFSLPSGINTEPSHRGYCTCGRLGTEIGRELAKFEDTLHYLDDDQMTASRLMWLWNKDKISRLVKSGGL